MAKVKPKGPGQGKGGGRPRRQDAVEEVRLRLTPRAAELLRGAGEDQGIPAWQVVERLLAAEPLASPEAETSGAMEGGRETRLPSTPPAEGVHVTTTPSAPPPLPPEAQEIAQECAAFLEAAQDRPRAAKALRRAWVQAIALARHDLWEVSGVRAVTTSPVLILENQNAPAAPSESQAAAPPVRAITHKH